MPKDIRIGEAVSLGYMEGLYSKWPRIDKELKLKYHKGLIATTCCIGASVPQSILKKGERKPKQNSNGGLTFLAKITISSCKRHDIPEQNTVNKVCWILPKNTGK